MGNDVLVTANDKKEIRTKLRVGFFCVHNDKFEINAMLRASSYVKAQQEAEVYSMHSKLIHVGKSSANSIVPTSRYNKPAEDFYIETLGMVGKTPE